MQPSVVILSREARDYPWFLRSHLCTKMTGVSNPPPEIIKRGGLLDLAISLASSLGRDKGLDPLLPKESWQ